MRAAMEAATTRRGLNSARPSAPTSGGMQLTSSSYSLPRAPSSALGLCSFSTSAAISCLCGGEAEGWGGMGAGRGAGQAAIGAWRRTARRSMQRGRPAASPALAPRAAAHPRVPALRRPPPPTRMYRSRSGGTLMLQSPKTTRPIQHPPSRQPQWTHLGVQLPALNASCTHAQIATQPLVTSPTWMYSSQSGAATSWSGVNGYCCTRHASRLSSARRRLRPLASASRAPRPAGSTSFSAAATQARRSTIWSALGAATRTHRQRDRTGSMTWPSGRVERGRRCGRGPAGAAEGGAPGGHGCLLCTVGQPTRWRQAQRQAQRDARARPPREPWTRWSSRARGGRRPSTSPWCGAGCAAPPWTAGPPRSALAPAREVAEGAGQGVQGAGGAVLAGAGHKDRQRGQASWRPAALPATARPTLQAAARASCGQLRGGAP